ncbi:sugar ABC transporter permease [Paenibacillus sp. JCM 10914]|uniref:ABC transporter permease n=1 Tax=Paenibacillus sp. JCM 10914 TaxID=1236974 RepID=UPI0003CC84B3|nr:ABC transporter permease subunit [Paenibacillus sp. JCM 10914]GAE06391.1 ABC-type polysaccharide transport system, permease component [Paenibacillus sp. JCM 10914]
MKNNPAIGESLARPVPFRIRFGKALVRYKWFYLIMLPGLLYYLIYHYTPMFGLILAFKDYNLREGIFGSEWVGFKHFEIIFNSPGFYDLIRNTVVISFYRIIFGMLPDVVLALMLNEVRKLWFKKFIQTVTYGPYFLSWVIVYGLVFAFLAENSGIVNYFIREWGGTPVNFLASNEYFRPIIVFTDIWKTTGFGAIIYLAAMASINSELYEASVVDGASRWRQLWHITLPGIRDVFILLLILRIGNIMDAGFEQIFIFLNARVFEVGDIIDTWVFRRGLEELEFSIAAATNLFKSVIGLVLVIGANRLAKKFGGSGIW